MFVYTLNALLWNIVHRYMLKILNVDTIKKPSLRSEGLSGAYGTRTRDPMLAVRTGLEPVTPCVTGMYSNQLN